MQLSVYQQMKFCTTWLLTYGDLPSVPICSCYNTGKVKRDIKEQLVLFVSKYKENIEEHKNYNKSKF